MLSIRNGMAVKQGLDPTEKQTKERKYYRNRRRAAILGISDNRTYKTKNGGLTFPCLPPLMFLDQTDSLDRAVTSTN